MWFQKLEVRGQLLILKFDISTFVQGLDVWNFQLNLLKPSQYLEDTEQKLLWPRPSSRLLINETFWSFLLAAVQVTYTLQITKYLSWLTWWWTFEESLNNKTQLHRLVFRPMILHVSFTLGSYPLMRSPAGLKFSASLIRATRTCSRRSKISWSQISYITTCFTIDYKSLTGPSLRCVNLSSLYTEQLFIYCSVRVQLARPHSHFAGLYAQEVSF